MQAAASLRDERPGDEAAIEQVTRLAFRSAPQSDGTEQDIVRRLREAGALAVSLVAEQQGQVVGHVALSPVRIDGQDLGWHGLGPVSVLPAMQSAGIGASLVRAVVARAQASLGAAGIVLLGEPAYYQRFGFRATPDLVLEGVPPEYFLALPLQPQVPRGRVTYHAAFGG